jgi:hypothetical protein
MKRLWLISVAGRGGDRRQGDGGWQTCTDQQGRVVDERQCDTRGVGYRPGW